MSSTKKRLSFFAVVGSVVAIAAFASSSPPSQLESAGTNIVGTWRTNVSGAGFEDFFALTVFHNDKTMTTVENNPTDTSGGIGVWERIRGGDHANFAVTFEFWEDENFNGVADFRFQVRLTLQVDGNTMTGTGALDIYNVAGTELLVSFPPGTFIVEATRMTVIPE